MSESETYEQKKTLNIVGPPVDLGRHTQEWNNGYTAGHRQAKSQAAEIACEADAKLREELVSKDEDRDRLTDLMMKAMMTLGLRSGAWEDLPDLAERTANRLAALQQRVVELEGALADAIRRPMGVVPNSAAGLLTVEDLNAAEARRTINPPKGE